MKVLKPNRLSCLTRPYRYQNNNYLAITVYAMVDFSGEFFLETEQGLWTLFNEESVRNFGAEALDFGIPKRTPEIILNAYGFGKYAVNGRTAVSVSVNNVRKDLWVTGDRYWSDGRPSAALPFETIAINWRNAYGGAGFDENPLGKGHGETELNGLRLRLLPNIEDPAQPVIHEGRRYAPAGYSAIPIESSGRNRMLGTYDDQWRVHDFPGFARDIDWEYFNQSPARQRLHRLQPGDRLVFTHLHPDKETLATTVPPMVARAFIKKARADTHGGGFLQDVPLKLTTYWAYPHLEKAILIHQGAVPVIEDDASDISHILYAAEHIDSARTHAYYEAVFRQRVDPQTGAFHAMLDKQLADARFIRRTSQDEVELSPLLRNKLRKLENELARNASTGERNPTESEEAARAKAELAWLKTSRDGRMAREDVIEDMLKRQQQSLGGRTARKQYRKHRPASAQGPDDVTPSADAERQRFLQERLQASLAFLREDAGKQIEVVGGAHAMASLAAHDRLRQLRLRQVQEFEDIASKAPGAKPPKRDWSGTPRTLHRIYGLNQLSTEPLPAGHDGYELHGFVATGTSYAGWNLAGLTIRESRISDCDFTKSRMANCDLDGVVFQGCDFSSADWDLSYFRRCQFVDCRLPHIQSDKARFEDCRFVRSDLAAWMHFRITLTGCTFEHCRFANFSYMRGRLRRVAFENCHFLRHSFIKGKIQELRMDACRIDSMSFVGIGAIQGYLVSRCVGSKLYVSPDTAMRDLVISHSTISASGFRKVDFQRGAVVDSDLSDCDFSEATMQDIGLQDSFFKRCLFIRTDLTQARIGNSDFSEAQMKSADLTAASLRHVSFFGAELSMVKADAKTTQHDMLMDRSNVYPLRK